MECTLTAKAIRGTGGDGNKQPKKHSNTARCVTETIIAAITAPWLKIVLLLGFGINVYGILLWIGFSMLFSLLNIYAFRLCSYLSTMLFIYLIISTIALFF